jgi:hypothetical protein
MNFLVCRFRALISEMSEMKKNINNLNIQNNIQNKIVRSHSRQFVRKHHSRHSVRACVKSL